MYGGPTAVAWAEAFTMAAVEAESMFPTQGDISKYNYAQVARQFQNAIADIAQTLPQMCTTLPKQSKCGLFPSLLCFS